MGFPPKSARPVAFPVQWTVRAGSLLSLLCLEAKITTSGVKPTSRLSV